MDLERVGNHLRGGVVGDHAMAIAWSADPETALEKLPASAIEGLDRAHGQALSKQLNVEPKHLTIGHMLAACPRMIGFVLQSNRGTPPPALQHYEGIRAALSPLGGAA